MAAIVMACAAPAKLGHGVTDGEGAAERDSGHAEARVMHAACWLHTTHVCSDPSLHINQFHTSAATVLAAVDL